jgi:hypothetical protein
VRYEDLVREPRETLAGVFEYLELDSGQAVIEDVLRQSGDERSFTGHGTSATLEQSIGRWEREGDAPFRSTLNELFREGLTEFGY